MPNVFNLASSSSYRRELLKRLQIPFSCISPNVDESRHGDESPVEHVRRLALLKARVVFASNSDSVVIGADQICVHDGNILGKPGDYATAKAQLAQLSGQRVDYISAMAVLAPGSVEIVADHACHLSYRTLSRDEIATYLALEQPYDCAGSLKAEGLGIALLDQLQTDDPTSIIGLPLITLLRMLRHAQVDVLQQR